MNTQETPEILKRIITKKKEILEELKNNTSLKEIEQKALNQPIQLESKFTQSIRENTKKKVISIIAELKKASPSKGLISKNFDPIQITQAYEKNGATCLSVLTDTHFFQGSNAILTTVRENTSIPILRKDFIFDPWQVYETRLIGADCMLLILSALSKEQFKALYDLGKSINLDILVEVHNEEELNIALEANVELLGINNRNLHTFETSLENTQKLLPLIPKDTLLVTESGIKDAKDIRSMIDSGVYSFLIGESLMKTQAPGEALKTLLAESSRP